MKPILFNTDMVRAILEGRKTVTRRVVKPKPQGAHEIFGPSEENDGTFEFLCGDSDGKIFADWITAVKMPYRRGDILYVPQAWKCRFAMLDHDGLGYEVVFRDGKIVRFRFDEKERAKKWAKYARKNDNQWQSPYFMPREAARIFLRVTDVRAERLQASFTEPICPILELQAEGIGIGETCQQCIENYYEPCCVDTVDEDGTEISECGILDEVRGEFSDLWDSTIKPADRTLFGWEANPWVWVIEFERCGKPEVSP